jgi:hypothetical protein
MTAQAWDEWANRASRKVASKVHQGADSSPLAGSPPKQGAATAKLIERTRQSKNCYCLAEAYIGVVPTGENRERTMRNFLFFLASAHLLMVGIAQAQMYIPPVNPGASPSYTAPSYAAPSYTAPRVYAAPPGAGTPGATPGATRPGYMWREQRAGEDWRNNTWREQRTYEDVRTNSWRQERAKEDWQQRQKIEKEKLPNNSTETGYLSGCPTGAPTSTCQSNPAGSINASGATNAAGATSSGAPSLVGRGY